MTDSRPTGQYPDVGQTKASPSGPRLEAFDEVYQREFSYVYKTLRRLGVPSGETPDAVHDTFVVLYRRWEEVDPARPIRPWIFGISRRVAAKYRRRRGPDQRQSNPEALAARGAAVDDEVARRELLWSILAELDEDRCVVFVLHDLEGHTAPEIARILDIPINTVYSRLRVARQEVRQAVNALRGGPP